MGHWAPRWKSDKQVRAIRRRDIDSFKFFSHTAVLNNSKHVFLEALFLFHATNRLFESIRNQEQFKNKFRLKSQKKLRTAQPQPEVVGSYKKKACMFLACS